MSSHIKDSAFKGADFQHKELPNTLVYIGDMAFEGCTALEEITIPYTVAYLGKDAFKGCTNLKVVIFEEETEGGISVIRTGTFAGCPNLKKVVFSSKLEYIEKHAFDTYFKVPEFTAVDRDAFTPT